VFTNLRQPLRRSSGVFFRKAPRHRTRKLALEAFESRRMCAVFTVTSPLDTNGVGELRTAIASANFSAGPDTIDFAPGVSNIALALGEIQITDDLTIDGGLASGIVVSIAASNNARIFRIDDVSLLTSQAVTLQSLVLDGGDATSYAQPWGGAILNRERLTMVHSQVSSSIADEGGGIANFGRLHLEEVLVRGNRANHRGGGVFTTGSAAFTTVDSTRFANNLGVFGGAFAAANGAHAAMTNSVLVNNSVQVSGGGIAVLGGSQISLNNVDINQNQAGVGGVLAAQGGGIYAVDSSIVTIAGSRITGNGQSLVGLGVARGGGIYAGSGSQLRIATSEISGNHANRGGGISAISSAPSRTTVTIEDSIINNNNSQSVGGGIDVDRHVTLSLECVTISGNSAAVSGGGMSFHGAAAPHQIEANVANSVITANNAGQRGGGIYSIQGTELEIENSIVSENESAGHGGGMFLAGRDPVADGLNVTSIRQSLISNNAARDPGIGIAILRSGGGIWVGADAILEVETSTIQRNRADTNGGGIANFSAGRMAVRNSTLSGNVAVINGGGASVIDANAVFFQSTLAANEAGQSGGGILFESNAPVSLDVDHSTLSRNSAAVSGIGQGAGIAIVGSPTYSPAVNLNHTIVSNNIHRGTMTHDEISDDAAPSGNSQVTAQFSLIRDNSGTSLTPGNPDPNGNKIGTVGSPIDAMLQPLGSAGGTTATMVPMLGSPVINAGSPAISVVPLGDQRQLPYKRVFGGRIDIGSVEVQPPPPDPDFNNDGDADCRDIDALVAAIVLGLNPPAFDLTGEGVVNRADLEKWLDDAPIVNGLAIQRYLPGDANLDTVVDGVDFGIWNAHKFTVGASWCRGDFNADGFIDGGDFGIWNAHKFTASPPLGSCGYLQDNRLATVVGGDDHSEAMTSEKSDAKLDPRAEAALAMPVKNNQMANLATTEIRKGMRARLLSPAAADHVFGLLS
jgi:hypothetical protein